MENYNGPERRTAAATPQAQFQQDVDGIVTRALKEEVPIESLRTREDKGTPEYKNLIAAVRERIKKLLKTREEVFSEQYLEMQLEALEKTQVGDYVLHRGSSRISRVKKVNSTNRGTTLTTELDIYDGFTEAYRVDAEGLAEGYFELLKFNDGQKVTRRRKLNNSGPEETNIGTIKISDNEIVVVVDGNPDYIDKWVTNWRPMTKLELLEYNADPDKDT